MSRNTVRKYLSESEPRRVEPKPRERPVFDLVRGRLDALLAEWSTRTTQKQRITGSRLHSELLREGHRVGLTLVRDHLQEWRRQRQEVYVPLVHHAGDEAQVDFFEITVEIAGVQCKVWMFLMRLMYSGRDFVWLYERADQVSFLDGHVRAFEHFGGVVARCVYDNLKAAVAKLVMPDRKLTTRLLALASHYVFEPCFARPGEGHDKGGVESRGRGIRLQHLVPIPRGESLAKIAAELQRGIDVQAAEVRSREDGRTVEERFREEQPQLRPLPSKPFEARRTVLVEISSTARAQVEGAWYSVPSRWARLEATAYVGVNDIVLTCRGESVLRVRQRFGGRDIRYRDYLRELGRKPQAVRQVASELIAELGQPFDRLWKLLVETHGELDAARVLARVLAAIEDHGESAVSDALVQALAVRRTDLLGLSKKLARPESESNQVPAALARYTVEAARATDFDALLFAEGAA